MVIYTTLCVEVNYVQEDGILLISWKQMPDINEFKDIYLKVLQFATGMYPTALFCTDLSHIGSLKNEQEAWLNTEYYKQVYSGLKKDIYTAVVFSEEHFKAIISNYKATETETVYNFINFNYFTALEEAYSWLASIKKGQDVLVLPQNIA